VLNGGFENNAKKAVNWTIASGSASISSQYPAPEGSHYVSFNGQITQVVPAVQGDVCTLSFWAATDASGAFVLVYLAQTNVLYVEIPAEDYIQAAPCLPMIPSFMQYSLKFPILTDLTLLGFTASGGDIFLDGVTTSCTNPNATVSTATTTTTGASNIVAATSTTTTTQVPTATTTKGASNVVASTSTTTTTQATTATTTTTALAAAAITTTTTTAPAAPNAVADLMNMDIMHIHVHVGPEEN